MFLPCLLALLLASAAAALSLLLLGGSKPMREGKVMQGKVGRRVLLTWGQMILTRVEEV